MSEEKTLDELKAELETLKKQNVERELAKEKAKIDEAEKLKQEKEADELKEKLRNEVMQEMKGKSTIEKDKPETLNKGNDRLNYFMNDVMKNKYSLEHESYEDMVKKMSHPKYYKGRR